MTAAGGPPIGASLVEAADERMVSRTPGASETSE